MMKSLRLSILSMLLMMCGMASAQIATFDFDNDAKTIFPTITGVSSSDSHDGDFTVETTSVDVNGVTVTVSPKSSGSNENRLWGTAPVLRLYSGTLTIKSSKTFRQVVFSNLATNASLIANNNTVSTGELSEVKEQKGNTVTWTGEATELVVTIAGNTQIGKIQVFEEQGDTPDPDPDPEVETVANIAAFKALANNTEAKLTLDNAQVLFVGSSDMFVRDNTGAIDFYNTGLSFKAGQVLNGSVIGKFTTYNNLPELVKTDNTNANDITATEETVTAKEIGLDEVAGYACDLIVVKDVTLVKDGNNWFATNGDGDRVQVYDKFKLNYTAEENKSYDITGIVIPYKESFEIAPIADFTGAADIPATPVASIADLLQLESPSTNLELTLTNAQVLFNDGNYIYLRENGAAVCFYSAPAELKTLLANNAIINGKVPVDYEVYRLMPEVKSNVKTPQNTLTATEGEAAVPVNTTVADVAEGKNVCDLVTLKANLVKEVTYKEDGETVNTTTYYLQSGDVKIVAINNGKNLNKIEEGTEIEVVGVVNTNNNAYQVKLIKNAVDPTGIENVVAVKASDMKFNLAGQRVNSAYKGVVIVGGKKMIVK